MSKMHFGYRNAKGHGKWLDLAQGALIEWPDDMPEASRTAAELVVASMLYGPPVPVEGVAAAATQRQEIAATHAQAMDMPCVDASPVSGKGQGRRGRPKGYKCSPETRAQMAQSKRAMWDAIRATMAETHPEKWNG